MRIKKRERVIIVLLCLVIFIPNISLGAGATWEDFFEVKSIIEEGYYIDIDEGLLLEGATKGLFKHLDEYSEYYTAKEFKELESSLSGTQVGIGIYLIKEGGYIKVLAPVEGGAADRAGMRSGDIIESIDGVKTEDKDIEEVIKLLIGEEETYINLVVRRGGRTLPFYIQRETITLEAVDYGIIDKKIGYINIEQFVSGVGKEVDKALKLFESKGINNIILDLRDNPGGYLNEALEVSNRIIPKGPVVHVKYKMGEKTHNSNAPFNKNKYNLIVMVNEGSASASEIIAGAVKDRKVGKIVGTKTYGKSKVQEVIKLNNGGLKLTIAEYFTPNRIKIGGKGIEPDLIVKDKESTIDTQLEAVKKCFKSKKDL